jgi:Histidine phosphatase superfamily (branch 1)
MMVIAITHADAVSRNPRSLSAGGRQQALLAARRMRELVGNAISLGAVLSSPSARCLETAIIVAREFGETTKEDGIYDGRLNVCSHLEAANIPRTPADLSAALSSINGNESWENRAALVAVHADLANMLSESCTFDTEVAFDGWFRVRPVLAWFLYTESRAPEVSSCETLECGCWVSCDHRT